MRSPGPTSAVQLPQLVDVDGQLAPVHRDDDPEADRHLAGRDDHDDDGHDLAVAVAVHAAERDEREVRGVEHQLEAEQDHQRVAPDEHAAQADGEHERRDDEEPGDALQPASGSSASRTPAATSGRVVPFGWLPGVVPPTSGSPLTASAIVPVPAGRSASATE